MRAIPFILLAAGLCALDVGLFVGLAFSYGEPNPPNRIDLASLLVAGIVGGFA